MSDLKQIESAARNLADYIRDRGTVANPVVVRAQAGLIADRVEVFYTAALIQKGSGTPISTDEKVAGDPAVRRRLAERLS